MAQIDNKWPRVVRNGDIHVWTIVGKGGEKLSEFVNSCEKLLKVIKVMHEVVTIGPKTRQ